MAKILLILQSSAFSDAIARESQDLALALAATEHEVSLLYRGAAVLQLLPLHQTLAVKDFTMTQKLFDLYDIAGVYVCAESLAHYQLVPSALRIPLKLADLPTQQQLLNTAEQILVH
jgi:tRNA 2-thiouridine synthesizing protein C